MDERTERQIGRYALLNPLQRNAELRGLFYALPSSIEDVGEEDLIRLPGGLVTFSDQTINEALFRIGQRITSPYTYSLRLRLNGLLAYTEGTPSSQEYIRLIYWGYLTGIMDEDRKELAGVFEWDTPKTEGLFGVARSQFIERGLYKRAMTPLLNLHNLDIKFKQEGVDSDIVLPSDEELLDTLDPEKDKAAIKHLQAKIYEERLVRRWRREYFEKYNNEP